MSKIAVVKFTESQYGDTNKRYRFKTVLDNLEVGDKVVVACKTGYQVATFAGYTQRVGVEATAWIVQKVDRKAIAKAIEKEEKIAKIKAELQERKEASEELAIYKMLAEKDSVMKDLLEQLEQLQKDE